MPTCSILLKIWGYINFATDGRPYFTFECVNGFNYEGLDLNSLNIKSRFLAIICTFKQNNTFDENWTHELFGLWQFDTNTYVEKLKDFLLQNHDWDNENEAFKNEAISVFGQFTWEEEIARAAAWAGLENTSEFSEYTSNYQGDINFTKLQYIYDIKGHL